MVSIVTAMCLQCFSSTFLLFVFNSCMCFVFKKCFKLFMKENFCNHFNLTVLLIQNLVGGFYNQCFLIIHIQRAFSLFCLHRIVSSFTYIFRSVFLKLFARTYLSFDLIVSHSSFLQLYEFDICYNCNDNQIRFY